MLTLTRVKLYLIRTTIDRNQLRHLSVFANINFFDRR